MLSERKGLLAPLPLPALPGVTRGGVSAILGIAAALGVCGLLGVWEMDPKVGVSGRLEAAILSVLSDPSSISSSHSPSAGLTTNLPELQ